jgi:hypothetical protein
MTRRSSSYTSDYSQVLCSIFEFMLVGGMTGEEVSLLSKSALREAMRNSSQFRREASGKLATAALVLDAWHRERRYLDSAARPRAVRLFGRAPSVEALVRDEGGGQASAIDFARRMKVLGLVVPCGRGMYRPASSVALVSAFDPMVLQHVAHSLSTLLETISHNMTHRQESDRLIERFAEVPDLPTSEVAAFRRFSHVQSWAFLQTANDWLESRRAKRSVRAAGAAVRAGVHVHAYVSPGSRSEPPRKRRRSTAW